MVITPTKEKLIGIYITLRGRGLGTRTRGREPRYFSRGSTFRHLVQLRELMKGKE